MYHHLQQFESLSDSSNRIAKQSLLTCWFKCTVTYAEINKYKSLPSCWQFNGTVSILNIFDLDDV